MWFAVIIAALTSYLLGNLNGAVCISSLFAKEDVRSHGSGNAGLTNFIRNYGASSSLLVILIDAGKAVLGCFSAGLILKSYGHYEEGLALGGMCVVLGHIFPALLGFKGRQGHSQRMVCRMGPRLAHRTAHLCGLRFGLCPDPVRVPGLRAGGCHLCSELCVAPP